MLFDSTDVYEDNEYVATEHIPAILRNFLKWIISTDDINSTVQTLADKHVAEVFDNSAIMNGILGGFVVEKLDCDVQSPDDINSTNKEISVELLGIVKRASEAMKTLELVSRESRANLQMFNKTIVETEELELIEVGQPAVRLCQIIGCDNELKPWQHHSAKYCVTCQTSGAVKKQYNQRHKEKYKRVS